MAKEEKKVVDSELAERLAALEEENKKLREEKNSFTLGKQPLDEMIGAPRREPVHTKLHNGTLRTDR